MRYLAWALVYSCLACAVSAQTLDVPEDSDAVYDTVTETVVEKSKHDVVVANTLWDLAAHYYKDPWKWPRIYQANVDRIKDPHWIYPGQTFIIPGLDRMVKVVRKIPKPKPKPKPKIKAAPPPPPVKEVEPPVDYKAYEGQGAQVLPDSLSVKMPGGMAGQQPSMYRMRMSTGWKPDGEVITYLGTESMAATGDNIRVKITGGRTKKNQRYSVYRWAAMTDSDRDDRGKYIDGKYVQKVGLIKLIRKLGGGEYRAEILQSGGSVQAGDVLKREE